MMLLCHKNFCHSSRILSIIFLIGLLWNPIQPLVNEMNYFKSCCLSWDSSLVPHQIDNKIPIKFIRDYLNIEFYGNKKIYCYDIDECISLIGLSTERPLYIKNIPSVNINYFQMIIDWFIEKYRLVRRVKVTDFMY